MLKKYKNRTKTITKSKKTKMEYLSILNAFGRSYLSQMKEREHEAAVKAANLTSKFCNNTHQNLNQNQHNHNYQQLQQHGNSKSKTYTQNSQHNSIAAVTSSSPCSSLSTTSKSISTSLATPTPTTTTTTTTLMLPTSLPSPPASRTSSTASSPGNSTVAATTSAAAAAAVLHLQQLQQHQQHLQQQIQVEQEQQQQRRRHHHHHYQQQQMQHNQETLQHHAMQQNHHHHHHQHHNHLQQQQQQNDSHVANSLLWQPWRDLQHAAAVHHRLYQQQLRKEARLNAKELPTAKWRRDRRMRAAEYHTSSTSGMNQVATTTSSSSPPPAPTAITGTPDPLEYVLHPVPPHDISSVAGFGATPPAPSTSPHTAPMSMMVAAAAAAAANMRPLCESTNRISNSGAGAVTPPSMIIGSVPTAAFIPQHAHQHALAQHQQLFAVQQQSMESPLDMSVSSSNALKQRSSPPPPYREPLPGSSYATSLARPSVITQAPSKRGIDSIPTISGGGNQILISNRENENRSTESVSMCENVIDEHFRRSLGADYAALFGKRASPAPSSHATSTPSPQPAATPQLANTPPPPVSPQAVSAHNAHSGKHNQLNPLGMQPPPPAYHLTLPTRPLISPKPATELLSPTAAAAYIKEVQPPNAHSPSPLPLPLLPPQQQPLSLHRSASNSPGNPASPQPLNVSTTNNGNVSNSKTGNQTSNHIQRLTTKRRASPPPPLLPAIRSAVELPINHSPTPSPSHTPPVAAITNTAAASIVLPAIMRIKTEPGLPPTATTTTPPASPNSSSNASNSDVMASVDDHFAKALGDTWKKLQERK